MVQTAMSLRDPALALHIASGSLGLVLGPVAMTAPKRRGRHTRAGGVYFWAMAAVCVSAVVLAALDWARLWFFLPIAAFSFANALLGYLAVRIRWRGWLRAHIGGVGGSCNAADPPPPCAHLRARPPCLWVLPPPGGSPALPPGTPPPPPGAPGPP